MKQRAKKEPQLLPEELLKNNGFKQTALRIAILTTLQEQNKPLTIAAIAKKVKKHKAAITTIYRALTSFVEKSMVKELSLTDAGSSYELIRQKHHMHHIVCKRCNTIEPISFCVKGLEQGAKEKSKLFNRIAEHTISFSGTCRKCVRAVR